MPEHDADPQPLWRRYLRFLGTDVRADVDDEIAFHLQGLVDDYIARGLPPDEARRAALARFGDRKRIATAMHALAMQREITMRRTEWLDALGRDLRFALRQLRKRPGFTVATLVTLALGIGANTAIFSAVNSVLLHPVPARDLSRLTFIEENIAPLNLFHDRLDPSEAMELTSRTDLFEASAGLIGTTLVLSRRSDAEQLTATRTLGQFFALFGTVPYLGRFYRPDESRNGQDKVVVLAYDLWRSLGADPALVGSSIELSGDSYQIIGVAPPGFRYPRGVQVWMPYPVTPQTLENHGRMITTALVMPRPGVSPAQLQSQLAIEADKLHPRTGNSSGQSVVGRADFFFTTQGFVSRLAGPLQRVLLVLLGAVAFVLLIACANIASLQLVHGTVRAREFAVRAAVGAGRGAIVRQLLIENLVLALSGGALGIVTGTVLLRLVARAGAAQMPALEHMHLDGAVLAFTAAATVACGLLFGLVPAWRAGRVDLHEALKDANRTSSLGARKHRLLGSAVVLQVGLALVLILGSGLMIRSLARLLAQDPGFRSAQVSTMRLTLAGPRYADSRQTTIFYDRVLDQLRAMPGIDAVGLVSELPFSGTNDSSPFRVIGRDTDRNAAPPHANLHTVGGDYFEAMGIPLIRGRVFDRTDARDATPVAVIDAQLAHQYFPNEDPIGQRINQGPDVTIIGVVGSVSQGELGEHAYATVYYPQHQHDWYRNMFLTVRSQLPLSAILPTVRTVVKSTDPTVPVYEARTLTERIGSSLAPRRLTMVVLSGLAALSLLLAVFGLYGVISYAVTQRTTEFGIRAALGAGPSRVRAMVVREGMVLALAGIAVGLLGAAASTRALVALLFDVSPHDPLTFTGSAVVLGLVAAVASYIPARRATRVSPVEALRTSG